MSRSLEQVCSLLMGKSDEDRFTLHAAAQILGVSYPTLQRYRKNKWLLVIQFGNRFEVTVKELKRFAKNGNYTPGSPQSLEEHEGGLTTDYHGNLSLALCSDEQIRALGSEGLADKLIEEE